MEQRIEWRLLPQLVDPDHEWQLFDQGGLAFALGEAQRWVRVRCLQEVLMAEMFQELSLASRGLLAWLAWDLEIDVKAIVAGKDNPDRPR